MTETAMTETADVRREVDDLRTRGWCVVPGVMRGAGLDAARDQVRRAVIDNSRSPAPRYGVSNLFRFDQSLFPALGEERVTAVAEAALGPNWRISFATGYVTGPGTGRDIWHADFPFNQRNHAHVPAPYPDAVMHLTTFWMLTDFTPANGATYVVPGSHRTPDHPRPDGPHGDWMSPREDEARLVGSAGDVAILDSRLWHAVSPNTTAQDRITVVVRFAPWWLNLNTTRRGHVERQLVVGSGGDSFAEDLPREVYDQAPDDLKSRLAHLLPQGSTIA